MGYYSNVNIVSEKALLKDYDVLNQKIKELEYNNDIVFDEFGNAETSEESFKRYDDAKLAELISNYLIRGSIELYYIGEDGERWGWKVLPKHTVKLKAVISYIPEKMEEMK